MDGTDEYMLSMTAEHEVEVGLVLPIALHLSHMLHALRGWQFEQKSCTASQRPLGGVQLPVADPCREHTCRTDHKHWL